jgi:hypothetical protein
MGNNGFRILFAQYGKITKAEEFFTEATEANEGLKGHV